MKIIANHYHGKALVATKTKTAGKYNLWERDFIYGHSPKKIILSATLAELREWLRQEYAGCQYMPAVHSQGFCSVLIEHEFREANA